MRHSILLEIRDIVARRAYAFTIHAVRQAEEREITPAEMEEAILDERSEIIEDYPNDARGPSCLILGWTKRERVLHIQVAYPPTVIVITLYEPTEDKWIDERTRREQ